MDYHARMYDDLLGRFVSPDTITAQGSQGLNRYSYVGNDPIINTDPSGHCTTDPDDPCNSKGGNSGGGSDGGGGDDSNCRCYRLSTAAQIAMDNEYSWLYPNSNPAAIMVYPSSSGNLFNPFSMNPMFNIPHCGNEICREQALESPDITLHWSFYRVDQFNLGVDILGLGASIIGGKPVADSLKIDGLTSGGISFMGSVLPSTNSLANPSNHNDLTGKMFSVGGFAPFPYGTIAAAGAVLNELAHGFWQTYNNQFYPFYGPPAP